MHRKHKVFFLVGLLLVFAMFFLYLVYEQKNNVFYPKPPIITCDIAASDSGALPGLYQFTFEDAENEMFANKRARSGSGALKVSGFRSATAAVQIMMNSKLLLAEEALFGAWLFIGDTAVRTEGKLVFQIVDKANKVKFSAASEININEMTVAEHGWFYVCGKAAWKDYDILPSDLVKIYYWNNCNNTVYVDDVQVIFGRQIIKGDKTLIDLSSHQEQYIPGRNQPPYRTIFFDNIPVTNVIGTRVLSPYGKDSLMLSVDDVLCPGMFVNSFNRSEQILVLRNSKPLALLWFEKQNSRFSFVNLSAAMDSGIGKPGIYATADVDGDGTDEWVTCSGDQTQRIEIYKFQAVNPHVKRVFSKQANEAGVAGKIIQIESYHTANNKNNGIALLDDLCHVFLMHYEKNSLTSRLHIDLSEANSNKYVCKMVCGKFLDPKTDDNLLFLYTEKKSGRCFYKITALDKDVQGMKTLVQGNFDSKCDTLYADNEYFTCDLNADNVDEILSFFNGWRYDGKLCSFDKDGYNIMANIDFTGYPKDFNPKYYEKITLTAGKFIDKNTLSVFVLCGSLKHKHRLTDEMPPYICMFSYLNPK
ncbi:MAG TPA: hypothetical protein PKW80_08635 [Bacteroidales bacterium]|nr:hypothetical protein [Bacteroidales bacterium]